MRDLLSRRILFFGGKGGVGKTTCSTACALGAAAGGRRVLLVSTDPAHSTSDVLGTALGPDVRPIVPNLWGLEIDADTEVRRYLDEAKRKMAGLFSPAVLREAARQIELTAGMPGAADVALFDRMAALIATHEHEFDLIVFDTAPTGHSLRLLRMPEMMAAWVDALARRRREVVDATTAAGGDGGHARVAAPDPILSALEQRAERLASVRNQLVDRHRVAFVLVLVAERLPIEESVRAAQALDDAGMAVGALIVNRTLPDGEPGAFLRARRAQEARYLAEIERRLSAYRRILVPQLESDIHGLAGLETIGRHLFGD
jgi:arsenite/tail-anchored protein-transporting ATPase